MGKLNNAFLFAVALMLLAAPALFALSYSISGVSPADGATIASNTLDLTFTPSVDDANMAKYSTCFAEGELFQHINAQFYSLNSGSYRVWPVSPLYSNTPTTIHISNIQPGTYTYDVMCSDSRMANKASVQQTVTIAPASSTSAQIEIVSSYQLSYSTPAPGFLTLSDSLNVNFRYLARDSGISTSTCYLSIDGQDRSSVSASDGQTMQLTASLGGLNANYRDYYQIRCEGANPSFPIYSMPISLQVRAANSPAPAVTLTSPINNALIGPKSDFRFRYDAGSQSAPVWCGLFVDTNGLQDVLFPAALVYRSDNDRSVDVISASDNYYLKDVDLSALPRGSHHYILRCSAVPKEPSSIWPGDTRYFETYAENSFTLGDPSNIELLSPSSSHSTKDHAIDFVFVYHAGDLGASMASCSLMANGQKLGSLRVADNQQATITVQKFKAGDYRWRVQCDQNISENRSLYIEPGVKPSVQLLAPLSGYKGTQVPSLKFVYTAGDDAPVQANCELGFDVSIQNQTLASSNVPYSFNQSLAPGNYTWYVQCGRETNYFVKSPFASFIILPSPGGKPPSSLPASGGGEVKPPAIPPNSVVSGGTNSASSLGGNASTGRNPSSVNVASLLAPVTSPVSESISLLLLAESGASLSNAQIRVYGPDGRIQLTTDASGRANFTPNQIGNYTYSVPDYVTLSNPSTEVMAAAEPVPEFASSAPSGGNTMVYFGLALLLLLVLGLIFWYIRRHEKKAQTAQMNDYLQPHLPTSTSQFSKNAESERGAQMHAESGKPSPSNVGMSPQAHYGMFPPAQGQEGGTSHLAGEPKPNPVSRHETNRSAALSHAADESISSPALPVISGQNQVSAKLIPSQVPAAPSASSAASQPAPASSPTSAQPRRSLFAPIALPKPAIEENLPVSPEALVPEPALPQTPGGRLAKKTNPKYAKPPKSKKR